jgi:hypothetical protein
MTPIICFSLRRKLALVMVLAVTLGAVAFGAFAPAAVGLAAPATVQTPADPSPADPCGPAQLALGAGAAGASSADGQRTAPPLAFVRTELFFGSNRPNLPPVSDADWSQFLDGTITRCFPDGLTVLTGDGQFRNSTGQIIRERSFVLILLYPVETRRASSAKIEFIREAYKAAFQQESVLRVDDRQPVSVAFDPLPAWAVR